MVSFYANEQFPLQVVQFLRSLGHNVLTVQEAENRGLEDKEVLVFATCANRAVLTLNRRHFIRLLLSQDKILDVAPPKAAQHPKSYPLSFSGKGVSNFSESRGSMAKQSKVARLIQQLQDWIDQELGELTEMI